MKDDSVEDHLLMVEKAREIFVAQADAKKIEELTDKITSLISMSDPKYKIGDVMLACLTMIAYGVVGNSALTNSEQRATVTAYGGMLIDLVLNLHSKIKAPPAI